MANNGGFKKFLNLLAFIAVVVVAIALLFSLIFKGSEVSSALDLIAKCIAYLVTAIYAFYYVYSQRNTVLTIVYFVAIIAIIILLIV